MFRSFARVVGLTHDLKRLCIYRSDHCKLHTTSKYFYNERAKQFVISTSPQVIKMPPRLKEPKKQEFDYFLVLDFEATCDSPVNVVPQEIIEFPVLKVNGETFETEAIFHSYVKPKVNPELTSFCTELTGIIQEMVENEPYFEDVFMDFNVWMKEEGLFEPDVKFSFVTCGDWDFRFLLQVQCKGLRIPVPSFMWSWINIKTCFAEVAQTYPRNLLTMLKLSEIQHEGRLHSGIDDCKNIAKLLKDLARRGVLIEQNGKMY